MMRRDHAEIGIQRFDGRRGCSNAAWRPRSGVGKSGCSGNDATLAELYSEREAARLEHLLHAG